VKGLFFVSLLLLAFGCTLGPDHEAPDLCLPCEFEEAKQEVESVDLSSWWHQFEDPQLCSLIDEALCSNLDLRIALQKVEEVRGFYQIERSDLYPQIAGNLVAIRTRRSENLGTDAFEGPEAITELVPTDFGGPLINKFFQVGIDASWEIDLWGKNRRKAEAGRFDFDASQEAALGVQITLISQVASSYIDMRLLQGQITMREEQIKSAKDLVHLAETRAQGGIASYLDVADAKAALDFQVAVLPDLKRNLKQTIHGLAILLGREPEGLAACFEKGSIPRATGKIPENLPSELLCNRPDIRQAEKELGAATARIGVAKGEFFPSFSLNGSFGVQSNLLDNLFSWPSRYWTVGPGMIWNLFTGGKLIGQLKVATERQKQAVLSYEKTVLEALQEVEDRLVGYYMEERRHQALSDRVESTQLFRKLAYEQYISGLISMDQVLRADRDLYFSIQESLASEGALMVQLVGLYKALGGGWQCSDSQ